MEIQAKTKDELIEELQAHQIELEMQNEELNRAYAELGNSKNRFSDLYDFAPVGYVTLSDEAVILEVNLRAVHLLGVERASLVNRPFFGFIIPDDQDIFYRHRRDCLDQLVPQTCELRMLKGDGTEFYGQLESVAVVGDKGPQGGLRTSISDVTERKRTEALLLETKEIFKKFMEYSPIYVFFKDENIRSLRLSKNFETMLGKPMEELLGRSMVDLFPSDLAKSMVADDMRILKEGKHITVEEELNGRFYSTSKFPIFIEGTPRYLAGFTIDITEQKQAEEALLAKTHQLNERVKELNCLHSISKLVEKSNLSLGQLLQEVVNIIPPSWQFPEIAYARVILQDKDFKTENYTLPVSKQHADIIVYGEHIGLLEVGYLEEAPECDEGPFLKEERRLIEVISERLGRMIERNQAEESLRISEEKFSKAFWVSPDAITITRLPDGMFVSVNEGFKHLTGYLEEEVIGKTTLEINIWDNPEYRDRLIEGLKGGGRVDNYEAPFRTKNGSIRHGLVSASIIVLNGVDHVLTITRDITERKLAEEQLRKSEEYYRLLTENMNDVIWQTTPDMVFTYVSPSIQKQRGYEPSEITGRPLWDFVAPNEVAYWKRRDVHPFRLPFSVTDDFEPYELHVRKDGTTLWTETMTTPVFNDDGKLLGFQGVTRDVTERKLAADTLRTTLGRFHTILSSLYTGVLVVTEENQVEFVNKAFCDLFHLKDLPENLRGMSAQAMIETIKHVYAQPDYAVSRIKAIVTQGGPVRGEQITMRDGRVYMVDFIPLVIEGKPYGRMWHHQDITGCKLLEETLRKDIIELETSGKRYEQP